MHGCSPRFVIGNRKTADSLRVLLSFLSTFLKRDYHIILYNSRGVGNSGGSPGWTGLSEAQDLQNVVDMALREIDDVNEIVLLVGSCCTFLLLFGPCHYPCCGVHETEADPTFFLFLPHDWFTLDNLPS